MYNLLVKYDNIEYDNIKNSRKNACLSFLIYILNIFYIYIYKLIYYFDNDLKRNGLFVKMNFSKSNILN